MSDTFLSAAEVEQIAGAIAAHDGPLYGGRLSVSQAREAVDAVMGRWLLVSLNDRPGRREVFLLCTSRLPGLSRTSPADAARQARVWLNLRHRWEVKCCDQWAAQAAPAGQRA